ALSDWSPAAMEESLRALAEQRGIGGGKLFQPLRVALTGLGVSPGIFDVMVMLGRERTVARIAQAEAQLATMVGAACRSAERTAVDPAVPRAPLTAVERKLWHYLIDFLAAHTFQPSVREIARHFRIPSTKTVVDLIGSLEAKGYVRRTAGRSRGLVIEG